MIALTIAFSLIYLTSTSTICSSSGHWLVTFLPSSFLLPFLPPSSLLLPPPPFFFHSFPFLISSSSNSSNHPVLIKFDKQEDCYSFGVIPSPNMKEFKLEIPFVEIKGKVFTFKIVFVDNWLNAIGGRWVYGIDMKYCQFSGDFLNDYELICDKDNILGNFKKNESIPFETNSDNDKGNSLNSENSYISKDNNIVFFYEGLINVESLPNFKETFIYLNQAPWLANTINFDKESIYCAYNIYDWDQTKGKDVYIKGNLNIMGQKIDFEGMGIYLEAQLKIMDKERC